MFSPWVAYSGATGDPQSAHDADRGDDGWDDEAVDFQGCHSSSLPRIPRATTCRPSASATHHTLIASLMGDGVGLSEKTRPIMGTTAPVTTNARPTVLRLVAVSFVFSFRAAFPLPGMA